MRAGSRPRPDRALAEARVSRVAADPAPRAEALEPGGWLGPDGDGRGAVLYHRWHGSPRTYWSRYAPEWIAQKAHELSRWPAGGRRLVRLRQHRERARRSRTRSSCATPSRRRPQMPERPRRGQGDPRSPSGARLGRRVGEEDVGDRRGRRRQHASGPAPCAYRPRATPSSRWATGRSA
jgi:hypothetical protein